MARALGVGGIFFKARDRTALGAWYQRWLGVPWTKYGAAFRPGGMPPDAWTAWGPFDAETTYFAPSTKEFMFNLIVDDLGGALAQVAEGGAEVVGEVEEYDYGRFGWFVDPEGNKVELWQPAEGAWEIVAAATDEVE
mgnify:CR=1 FL=1